MVLSVGTFNLNNLFSRFNYEAEVSELPKKDAVISSSLAFQRLLLAVAGATGWP